MIGTKHVVYLAGPMAGKTHEEACAWREKAARILGQGFICISPPKADPIKGQYTKLEENEVSSLRTGKAITRRDYASLASADAVFVNFLDSDVVSIGTICEVAWCRSLDKPCFIAMEPGSIHDHIMVREIATTLDNNLETSLSNLRRFFMVRDPAGYSYNQ